MHRKTIILLSTVLTTSFGMFFIAALIIIAAIKGWGEFGYPQEDISPWELKMENDEYNRKREEDPDLYSEPEDLIGE